MRTVRDVAVAGLTAVLLSAVLPAAAPRTLPVAAATAPAAPPPYAPSRLAHLGASRQVVVVTSASWRSTRAVLRGYQKGSDGRWRIAVPATPARIGYAGFVRATARRQGSGTTPAGTFRISRAFGTWSDPGTDLAYRRADRTDWWSLDPRDPATYNVYQPSRSPLARWRTSQAERIASFGAQYRHVAVLDFNRPRGVVWSSWRRQYVAREPADTRRGGAIFLHVDGPGATAGCVSVSQGRMRQLLRWLDPDHGPRIVMGPLSAIDEL